MSKGKIFQTTSRIVRGPGTLGDVANEIIRLKKSKVMIVTDPGIVAAGLVKKLEETLAAANITYSIYDQIEPDPRLQLAVDTAEQLRATATDLVIGIGGGSAIDIAKVAAVLVTNEAEIGSFIGIDQIERAGLPTIIIPTTAGTGSEVTPIAILSDHDEKLKKGIVSPYLFPTVALLDSELTVGLPPHVTAATGMDALIHAVEAFTSKNSDSLTDVFACRAMELLYTNIRQAFQVGSDITARTNMLEGSLLAGMAFANAGVTAVHAFAYPIGAEFHIPHGVANSIMLTPVMEFNMSGNLSKFAVISKHFGHDLTGMSEKEAATLAVDSLRQLAHDLQIPKHLSEFGIKDADIPGLAEGVMKVTRLLDNNPRTLTLQDAEAIYRKVL
ncbi:MAG: iron-containing alcohol dehydrogenase [Desulforhopalus sp.]